jgi:hypothetical protein
MLRRLASRCPNVFVNETTEAIDPDDSAVVRFARHLGTSNRRPLAEALVWASRVIVVDELLQHTLELAWSKDQ